MNPTLTPIMANEHLADLRRAAARRHQLSSLTEHPEIPSVKLRFARDADAGVLRTLAALDDAPELADPALMAIVDGRAVAALSLADGRVVADPFTKTEHAVTLLRMRAEHLASARRPRRRWRLPRLRLA